MTTEDIRTDRSLKYYEEVCEQDSLDWFGEQVFQNLSHHTIALAGEAGEFCNIVKKMQRGSLTMDEEVLKDLANELCDVFIYTMNIAALLRLDMDAVFDSKREFNAQRFGNDSGS